MFGLVGFICMPGSQTESFMLVMVGGILTFSLQVGIIFYIYE